MAVDGTLTMWAELIDSSELAHATDVDKALRGVAGEDRNYECEGVGWDSDFKIPLRMSITYWETAPIDLTVELRAVRPYLKAHEFLLFEEKRVCSLVRNCHTLRTILVTRDGIYAVDSSEWASRLKQEAGIEAEPVIGVTVSEAPYPGEMDDID